MKEAKMFFDTVTASAESCLPDSHFYFLGRFRLPQAGTVRLKLTAASWFEAWLDEAWLTEGPARFDLRHPEYEERQLDLAAGDHVLALHVHYEGVVTRLMAAEVPLFVYASVEADGTEIPLNWVYLPLDAYRKTGRRVDCVLGWIEWCRTEKLPQNWQSPGFDASGWKQALSQRLEILSLRCADLAPVGHVVHHPELINEGPLVNMSMFTNDPPSAFMIRQLDDRKIPAQGRWLRFDLGKVRLGRPEITLTAPAGTVVQAAYAELLHNGRVSPYISSSAGDEQTCNLDHFVLRGGRQTVKPLHPRGARFLEIHVFCDPNRLSEVSVVFEERVYYSGEPCGSFSCDDGLLNRIWRTGVETLRSCSEDAIIDNPMRERGQWLGDAVGAGMDILAVSYADLRPLKRGLLQAAQCAGPDGMIPAVFPGTRDYLPSFAIQWIAAIPHYFEITGDRQTLEALYPAAVANVRCFDDDLSADGLCMNPKRWNFIDWGYRGASTGFREDREHYIEMDPALSFFYLKALKSMARWSALLGRKEESAKWAKEEDAFRAKMLTFLAQIDGKPDDWNKIGYHSAALALGSGLLNAPESRAACVEYIRTHILSCFPNSLSAPRLYDPTVESSQLITPFFAHHVFPALIEAGEMDFVLDQFRVCWGWSLNAGLTTWPEVFDLRWSHCHQWSGCPTWILSRYVLGLHPRFDLGDNHYEMNLKTGSLKEASGVLPVAGRDEALTVSWRKLEGRVEWELETAAPVWVHLPGKDRPVRADSVLRTVL